MATTLSLYGETVTLGAAATRLYERRTGWSERFPTLGARTARGHQAGLRKRYRWQGGRFRPFHPLVDRSPAARLYRQRVRLKQALHGHRGAEEVVCFG